MGGSEETSLSAIKLYAMKVPPNVALDMSGSPYLIICYLLKGECGRLEITIPQLVG